VPLLARVRSLRNLLFRKEQLETDLDNELKAFVEQITARHVAGGMTRDAARRAAMLEVGSLEAVKDGVRGARLGNGLETTIGDARYAWRSLWRAPGFAIVATLTLGLGIGATTAIFSVVKAMLLENLPFRDPGRLVMVWNDVTFGGYGRGPLAAAELYDLRQRSALFEGFGGIWANTTVLTGRDPEQIRIGFVTADFFSLLGAAPSLGRVFSLEDDEEGAAPTILLSDALWRRRFGGDASIVGRTVEVDHGRSTVVGVMPPGFRPMLPTDSNVPDDLQAWLPLGAIRSGTAPRGQRFLRVVGRMKPGVALGAAQEEIASIGVQTGREHAFYGPAGLRLYGVGLHADSVRETRPTLLALLAGVGLLLVVACVNVAGLLVARAAARTRETAVRMALGAGLGRLLRQYAIEGLVLGALGGLAGMFIGQAGLAALIALRPSTLGRVDTATLDPPVLAFTVGVALTWGLLLSLAPLAEIRGVTLASPASANRPKPGSRVRLVTPYRRRAALVVCQVALSVVLLVAAGLLVRAFLMLVRSDPGFSSAGIVTFRVAQNWERFDSPEKMIGFTRELRERLAALPGITGVGAISHLPYDDGLPNWGTPYLQEGDSDLANAGTADTRSVMPGSFEAVRATLVEGRFFTEADGMKGPPVTIVDERLARRMWPGQSAIGRRLVGDPRTTGLPQQTVTVVGVVRHLRHRRPAIEVREQLYYPFEQAPRNPMAYVVRGDLDIDRLGPLIRRTISSLDPGSPAADIRPLSDYVNSARAARRFAAVLAAAFAVAALVLAAIGVYGVAAYGVTLRRRELGVRIALGATRGRIVRLVVGESARLAAAGLGIGLLGAAGAAVLLRTQLYGVTVFDPISYGLAIPSLAAAVILAAWLPARRATRVSPLESLRAE
jgi:putative ABC transport system permease protein